MAALGPRVTELELEGHRLRVRLDALEAVPVLESRPSGHPWWQQYAKALRGAAVAAAPTALAVLADGHLTLNELLLILTAAGVTGGVVAQTTNAPATVDVEPDGP